MANNRTNAAPEAATNAAPEAATNAAPEATKDDYVEVFIHKTSELDDPNDFVSVNGENFVIPKGKTIKVPAYVKAEIDRSRRAQEKLDSKIDALVAEASK